MANLYLPMQGSKREPVGFQINQQKTQALIHTANHFGEEWEETTPGRPLSSHFIDILSGIEAIRDYHNSTARLSWQLAHHAGEDPVNLSKISDHLSDEKRPMTKSCASGRRV